MNTISDLIDRAKAASHLPSDYAVAKRIGVHPSEIYAWRRGRYHCPQKHVMALAEMAGEPLEYWLALLEAERAPSDKLSQAWRDIADRLAS